MEPRAAAYQLLLHTGLPKLWNAYTSKQKRSVVFILVFLLLVWIRAFESSTPSSTVFYPHTPPTDVSSLGWHNIVADVGEFKLIAVADNDDANSGSSAGSGGDTKNAGSNSGKHAGKKLPSSVKVAALAEGTLKITGKRSDGFSKSDLKYSITWGIGGQSSSSSSAAGATTLDGVTPLYGTLASNDRGMELSTLQYWRHGKLYACDDHTGIVYEILMEEEGIAPRAVPRFILSDGDGNQLGGMMCEWSAVKGDNLVMGSNGKPWTKVVGGGEGGGASHIEIENRNQQWVKMINPAGGIKNVNWQENYEKIRGSLSVAGKGYVMHQCAMWSKVRQLWYFIPRHVSFTAYTPGDESHHGSTVIVVADANFKTIKVVALASTASTTAAEPNPAAPPPEAGVTECKFIPNGHDREIVLLKVVEKRTTKQTSQKEEGSDGQGGERTETTFISYASVIDVEGNVLLADQPLPKGWKFEGLELKPVIHQQQQQQQQQQAPQKS